MLAVASILCPRLNSKGDQSSACSGHFFAKNLLGFACSGQYFMSEIELKRGSKSSACSGHLFAKICLVLFTVAIILCPR